MIGAPSCRIEVQWPVSRQSRRDSGRDVPVAVIHAALALQFTGEKYALLISPGGKVDTV